MCVWVVEVWCLIGQQMGGEPHTLNFLSPEKQTQQKQQAKGGFCVHTVASSQQNYPAHLEKTWVVPLEPLFFVHLDSCGLYYTRKHRQQQ